MPGEGCQVELWREGKCCVMVRDGWEVGECDEEERVMTGPEALIKIWS
jgi:hypothetical protein